MDTYIFIILPFTGHYSAIFGLAKETLKNGNRVLICGTEKYRELIVSEGFEFLLIQYPKHYFIRNIKVFLGLIIKEGLDKHFVKERYRIFYKDYLKILELVKSYRANYIYIDEHLSEIILYFYPLNEIKVSILCTKLSTRKNKGIPPMSSYYVPSKRVTSNLICEFLWLKLYLKKCIEKNIKKIAFWGKDDLFFLKRVCKKKGIDFNKIIDNKNYYYTGISGVERIIIGTKELEFPWVKNIQNEKYILNTIERNETKYITRQYIELIENIKDYKFIVYCSFGTLGHNNSKRVEILIKKLLDGLSNNFNVFLIISCQDTRLKSNQNNVAFFKYVPQLHLLRFCNLMITHGGHNSIKECIQSNTKMLVFPLENNNDQPGNGVRVNFKKLGLLGQIEKDSSKKIWEKINFLLSIDL